MTKSRMMAQVDIRGTLEVTSNLIAVFALISAILSPRALAHDVSLPENLEELSLYEASPNIYVVHGIQTLPDKSNAAFISNSGIVLTDTGVVVVDTGGSREIGRRLVAEIRRITDKPVVAVFNTHIHGDHWLGNGALHEAFPEARFFAHARAIERLADGAGQEWSDLISQMTGSNPPGGDLVLPNTPLVGGESLDLGDTVFNIHHTGHAHTDSDIMVEVPAARLLFAGDIIEHGRAVSSDVPQDFNARGQIDAIRYALGLPVDTFVPGHGATGGREVALDGLRFLEILYASVKEHYEAGMMDFEMRDPVAAELNDFRDWFGFDELGRIISFVYQQVEADAFN